MAPKRERAAMRIAGSIGNPSHGIRALHDRAQQVLYQARLPIEFTQRPSIHLTLMRRGTLERPHRLCVEFDEERLPREFRKKLHRT